MRAKQADEFEYACTLLRVRGLEDFGWDPLEETAALFEDIASMLDAPFTDYARIRLGLLLYSHITEVDAIYRMLANMIRVCLGERYVMDPFVDLYRTMKSGDRIPPSAKSVVTDLRSRAEEAGSSDVSTLLAWFFNESVRNAFFHSDYILFEDEFRSREASFISEGARSSSIKLNELVDLIARAMAFFQAFMKIYSDHRRSYVADKLVRGRIAADGSEADVLLLASADRGLYGFRSG